MFSIFPKSVNDKELEVAQYLQKLFSSYDIKSDIVKLDGSDTRADLVAEIGEGKPVLGVSGHMDVVTTGDVNNWNYDPFKLTEDEQGRLHGRGRPLPCKRPCSSSVNLNGS